MEIKHLEDYNDELIRKFNFLAVSKQFKMIGSASLKNILYASDFDLNNIVKLKGNKPLTQLKKEFQKKFRIAEKDKNMYIPDFKCGEYNGEPLRWNKHDMKNGYKTVDGNKITFEECVLQKAVFKLDLTYYINGEFTDLSEFYLIDLDGKLNFDPNELQPEILKKRLADDAIHYYDKKNYLKCLKRLFAIQRLENKPDMNLIDFLNSNVGLCNQQKGNLDIIRILLEQDFKKPKISEIIKNLQIIKHKLANVAEFKFDRDLSTWIDEICEMDENHIHKNIIDLIAYLDKYIQEKTKKFILKQKYV